MNKGILSASVSVQKEAPFTELRFHPGINILWGADAEDVVLTLAGIFGGIPSLNGKAEIQWDADALLFVHIIDGACGVEKANVQRGRAAQQKYSLEYDFLALIRQEEGCIGAEFIVKKCWHWDPINVIMEWDKKETKFQLEKDTGGMAYETTTHIL